MPKAHGIREKPEFKRTAFSGFYFFKKMLKKQQKHIDKTLTICYNAIGNKVMRILSWAFLPLFFATDNFRTAAKKYKIMPII